MLCHEYLFIICLIVGLFLLFFIRYIVFVCVLVLDVFIIRQAEQGLQFDSTELHEYSYTFFANLAKVLGEDMGVHVGRLAPHLLKEIQVSHHSPMYKIG